MIRSKDMRGKLLLGIILLVFVVIVRLPSINIPLDYDSGSFAYNARLILQGEPLYGSHHPDHNLPGVYYTYAAVFAVFGDQSASIKLFLILWVWINALFIYSIGRRLSNSMAGILAAVFFVLVTSFTVLSGDSGENELFANLPLTMVFWLALGLPGTNDKDKRVVYILIGVISALGFLYKVIYITSAAAVIAMLFLNAILDHRRAGWFRFIKRSAWIFSGFALILCLVAGYFASLGLWQRILLIFQLGAGYVEQNPGNLIDNVLIIPMVIMGNANAVLTFIGIFAAGRILISLPRLLSTQCPEGLSKFMLVAWLFFSVILSNISGFAFSHYILLLIPPLSLLAGIEIGDLWRRFRLPLKLSAQWARLSLPVLMVGAILGNSLYLTNGYYLGYLNYLSGKDTLEQFIYHNVYLGPDNLDAVAIAKYIDQRTSPKETILTLTDQVQICYLANRRSSSDALWPPMIPLMGPPQRVFTPEPRYIVVAPYLDRYFRNEEMEWLSYELEKTYVLETTIAENDIYRRILP